MANRTPLVTAVGFAAVLVILTATDAVVSSHRMRFPFDAASNAGFTSSPQGSDASMGSVATILSAQGFETSPTSEQSLLARIGNAMQAPHTVILLKNGDRAALLSWVDGWDVKDVFNALKEALHASFSPSVTDVQDQTLTAPDKPTVNFLTFKDPSLSEERFVFARVRSRIYEFHVAPGKDAEISRLLTELSR